MDEIKDKIEAVLFTLGKFISLDELAKYCDIDSIDVVKEKLLELKKDYDKRECSLEIQNVEDKFKLNVRKKYGYLTNKLLATSEMDGPTTKTLAVIAYRAPVLQAEIIKVRGNKAYDHIKQLRDEGLVSSEPKGRSNLLKLTSRFYDYFDTAEPEIKELFKSMENKVGIDEEIVEEINESSKVDS